MDHLIQDLRFALRSLVRLPLFSVVAVTTLALGIGVNAAVFSAVDAVLLRSLDYREPERIVALSTDWRKTGVHGTVSAPDFHDWHDRTRSFAAMAYYAGGETGVSVDGAADYASAAVVTPEFFPVLGVAPQIGRVFDGASEAAAEWPAVIGHDFWLRRFGGRPDALGRKVSTGGRVFTIVGVMPPRFAFPDGNDIWYPSYAQPETTSRSAHNYWAVARLAAGVTIEQAQADLASVAADLERAYPTSNKDKGAVVVPLREELVGGTRSTLYLLLGAVALVLLIACANVANLLLARATGRRGELAIRAALGAGRRRLIMQLVTESLLLAAVSAGVGLVIARWGVAVFVAVAPTGLPRASEIVIDGRVLAFALAIAIASSLLFGVLPAVRASRLDLNTSLRQGGRGAIAGRRDALSSALVVAEVTLAVALVVGASLLVRSFIALQHVDLGFNLDHVLVVETAAPVRDLDAAERAARTYADLVPRLAGLPGVLSAAGARGLPGTALHPNGGYQLDGRTGLGMVGTPNTLFTVVTSAYFRTLGMPIKSGRDFSPADAAGAPPVAIVNEALARRSFPGGDPIGHQIQCGLDSPAFMTIVGVVGDVRSYTPSRAPQPELYMPLNQHPRSAASIVIVARTAGDPLGSANAFVQTIRSRAPDIPARASTMTARISSTVATPRFRMLLVGTFAALALVLAMAGVYGVMAYAVGRRTAEIGVRMAMGAAAADILRLVLKEGLQLAIAGIAIGCALAYAMARWLAAMLFGVGPLDPVAFVVVPIALLTTAAVATAIPALRAARVDPIAALRAD
jgi:putative ABC transport system permease protein